jgi:hypothetical protein
MPLQGHWDRVNTPLRAVTERERRLVWIVGALVAAATTAAVIVAIATSGHSGSGSATPAGCIRIEFPSTMGASASNLCGSQAAEFCRSSAAQSSSLRESALAQCRDQGYATPSD